MSERERVEAELDYLARLVREGGEKLSPATRERVNDFTSFLKHRVPVSSVQLERIRMVQEGLGRNNAPMVYDSLHRLRSAFQVEAFRESSAYRNRIVELEAEVARLRKQEDAEYPEDSEDEQESMVKKFNSSKNKVFIVMPFSPDFDDVWEGGIKRSCKDSEFAPLRVDQVSLSSWITDDVEEYIRKSSVVIADVTGNNPNVMFELGYALARGKNPIIITQTQDGDKVPFDISGIRHIEYEDSWQGIEQLSKDLKKYLVMTFSKTKKKRKTHKKSADTPKSNSKV